MPVGCLVIKMSRTLVNIIIDLIAALLLLGMIAAGYILRFPLPSVQPVGPYPSPIWRHQVLNKKTVAVKSVIWYDYSSQITDLQPLSTYLFLGVYSL